MVRVSSEPSLRFRAFFLLTLFLSYMRECYPEVNANRVWVDLCRSDAIAFQYCKAFLQLYVDNSTCTRVVLVLDLVVSIGDLKKACEA
ncbi:hypothetical protein F5Y03DRAFT_338598 [Xylaria venustula]|nr:hypothetical protein F5Y03DRAFT_338598 [Xylaria venustula]